MSAAEWLGIAAFVFTVLTFIHKLASAPAQDNEKFFAWVWIAVPAIVCITGLFFMYAFVNGAGSPSRGDIFNFTIWAFNTTWSGNALIVSAARRRK